MLEYNLGTFSKEMLDELVSKHKKDVANGITRHPPTKKIEGVAMPYYEVTMTEGTKCDLTQLPRSGFIFILPSVANTSIDISPRLECRITNN